MNHYFTKKIPNFRKNDRSMIIDNLHLTCKWNDIIIINSNEIEWNQKDIDQYHYNREFFLELILLNMNFIYEETERDQEILSIQYKNSMNKNHNILIDDRQIQIATKYHKSQAIMNDLKISLIYYQLRYRTSQNSLISNWIICL